MSLVLQILHCSVQRSHTNVGQEPRVLIHKEGTGSNYNKKAHYENYSNDQELQGPGGHDLM
ncbi:MAG: hypothetical protein ACP5KV_07110, partial [Candidatus Methanomethylicaceae archaeon]